MGDLFDPLAAAEMAVRKLGHNLWLFQGCAKNLKRMYGLVGGDDV